jgi:small-conductance mechanosensitive channel
MLLFAATNGAPPPLPEDLAGLGEIVAMQWQEWAWALGQLAVAALVGLVIHAIVFAVAHRIARESGVLISKANILRLKRPLRVIFPLFAMQVALPAVALPEGQQVFTGQILSIANIAAVIWLIVVILSVFEQHIKSKHRVDVTDNLAARRVHTQISVLTRVVQVFIIVIGVAAALMTLPRMRELGTGLLASAGVAGLVIGLAARPVLENLIAGLQLALTQPIRLDDVVIIDGEWGRIEEITTTYVVVRIWDERRLIVPFSKFISDSFQNWTRESAQILGTVFVFVDYTVPVERVREELGRIVEASPHWDKRVCVLQVTDTTERTVQLRALVSAASSGAAWELRVFVREKLIEFLQREFPGALPRVRVEGALQSQQVLRSEG